MDQKILDFLKSERISVLSVTLSNGYPHSAAMHFSIEEDPFTVYFSTDSTSRKWMGEPTKAALAVGLSETDWKTLQMEGDIRIAKPDEIEEIKKIHYEKNPSSKKFESIPTSIFLIFTPTWYRYTEFVSNPKLVISSEGVRE